MLVVAVAEGISKKGAYELKLLVCADAGGGRGELRDMRRWWYGEEPVLETDTKMEAKGPMVYCLLFSFLTSDILAKHQVWKALGKRARRFLESATCLGIPQSSLYTSCSREPQGLGKSWPP